MRLNQAIPVSLSKQKTGKYTYWCLRWFDSKGSRRGKTVGRVDGPNKISKRQADVLRIRMHSEVNNNPGRRDAVTGLSQDLRHVESDADLSLARFNEALGGPVLIRGLIFIGLDRMLAGVVKV